MAKSTVLGSPYLSKTLFAKGLQCEKYLWLEKNRPELKDEPSKSLEAILRSGIEVGILARDLFPGGLEIPYDGLSHTEQIELTTKAIADGVDTIYEAAFSYDGIFVKADILHRDAQGWNLYEVKSATSVKYQYLPDVSVQYYVVNGAGISVNKAYLVLINSQYVRHGPIDVHRLFAMSDITDEVVGQQSLVAEQAETMRQILQGDMPAVDIGPQCTEPYDCRFMGTCWQHVPETSVFDVKIWNNRESLRLYRQGIVDLRDVRLETLTEKQRMQAECLIRQEDFINKKAVRKFLGTIRYPLCFVDFETTFMMSVPLFDGTRPYQSVPFQYSLHVLGCEGGKPEHHEYLAPAWADPRKPLLDSLLTHLPKDACVLVYNKTFEIGRLRDLKAWFPEHADRIDAIIANTVDLMAPFQGKDIYLWRSKGSHSMKAVLNPMVPELSYEGMEIGEGEAAAKAWLDTWKMDDPAEVEKVRAALLAYCSVDTLGMVRIVERLKEMVTTE